MSKKIGCGYFTRMKVYLAEMFPVPQRLASATLLYFAFISTLARIHGTGLTPCSYYTLLGTWNIFALMLILRLMDELKDREIDSKLFSGRPLPSGKTLESDIRLSLLMVVVLYLLTNMLMVRAFWAAALVLGYSLLMFKYFFIPRMLRKYLLLNLMTHNPIIPLMLFYLVTLFSLGQSLNLRDLQWPSVLLLIVMYWAMFFAWEIARKIRSQEEEDAYVTYSQILGPLGAVLVAAGAQTIAFVIGLKFFWGLSLPQVSVAILAVGYGVTMWMHLRFLIHPNPVTSKMKPFAERFIWSVLAYQITGQILLT